MSLPDHGRYAYSPITGRVPFSWPEGKGLAVYVAVNLEHFAFGEGLGAELAPGGPQPDIPAIVARKDSPPAFDEMRDQAIQQPLVMGIALHPYIVGQPGWLRQLRRALSWIAQHRDDIWLTQAQHVASAFASLHPPQEETRK